MYSICIYGWKDCVLTITIDHLHTNNESMFCVLEWICVLEQNRWHAAYYRPHSSDSNITDLLNKDVTISETTLFLPFSNFIWTPPTQQMEPISTSSMQSHPSLLKLSQIYLGVLSCYASGDKGWRCQGWGLKIQLEFFKNKMASLKRKRSFPKTVLWDFRWGNLT